jgi:hypothetical protein
MSYILLCFVVLTVSTLKKTHNAPSKPHDPKPFNNEIGATISTELTWLCGDADHPYLHFDLYFGQESVPPMLQSNLEGLEGGHYAPSGLKQATKYYWKIVAKDDKGNSTDSDI